MLAYRFKPETAIRQAQGDTPDVLGDILQDGVNLALWQRQLPAHIEDFGALLLSMGEPLAESMILEVQGGEVEPDLSALATGYSDLLGYQGFIADVSWLVSAYACLLGAECVGLRLRVLDKAMCPRFHVDHVPVRLITTYGGVGSQWLHEGVMDRKQLGHLDAEPTDAAHIQQINSGEVALLKGERWHGNEGFGLIHRSPQLLRNERRLILTLDWLA
ncbi:MULTISPECIES: DUF1826 domain-containing protein [Pseudomonas syringae group]|uniref:DUF1826 domain-containing protein n=4 Tax=Pseudomonas syringae group TaxID=136849 RepID=A0A2V4Q205_PSESJ|nr:MULTISPECIES: DUF1826 domain-containing protein [Pseudomonas syringae group]RMU67199.1 hypothetical protein ALP24_04152 [Pseudomonas syringae pv. aptata]PYD10714.1 DUF1826 domain-containing protein [Pseudomonas syringae pv. pisi]PYD28410.1 DUF1826 domain-containing protein [Pseudomonas syringae pv. pisi]PYD29912.1 DUF1826 domain-containing protein [Pseudomonas syringae pv. pisi]RML60401.1 hypothetical protein ALQ93_04045 [Pseudomonas syringae pv. pisi]